MAVIYNDGLSSLKSLTNQLKISMENEWNYQIRNYSKHYRDLIRGENQQCNRQEACNLCTCTNACFKYSKFSVFLLFLFSIFF